MKAKFIADWCALRRCSLQASSKPASRRLGGLRRVVGRQALEPNRLGDRLGDRPAEEVGPLF